MTVHMKVLSLDSTTLATDSAYEDNETRALVRKLGFIPVVTPNPRRRKPWKLDRRRYKQRNHVERLFRRLKGLPVAIHAL